MSKMQKLLSSVLCGTQDSNIRFLDLQNLLYILGFKERIKGDHYIYTKEDIIEKINIQPLRNKAKPYQVKQIRNIILKYNLGDDINV